MKDCQRDHFHCSFINYNKLNMMEGRTGTPVHNQHENENQFLPKDPSQYYSMALDHDQRRSLILGNDNFLPAGSSQLNNGSQAHVEAAADPTPPICSMQNKNQGDESEEHNDLNQQNQFMLDHNSLNQSIKQGLMRGQSNLNSLKDSSDIKFVNRNQENSLPFGQESKNVESALPSGQLQSKVEKYVERKGLQNSESEKGSSNVRPETQKDESDLEKMVEKSEEKQGNLQSNQEDIQLNNTSGKFGMSQEIGLEHHQSFPLKQSGQVQEHHQVSRHQEAQIQSNPSFKAEGLNSKSGQMSLQVQEVPQHTISPQIQKSGTHIENENQFSSLVNQKSNIILQESKLSDKKQSEVKEEFKEQSPFLLGSQTDNEHLLDCPDSIFAKQPLAEQPSSKSNLVESIPLYEKGLFEQNKSSIINRIIITPPEVTPSVSLHNVPPQQQVPSEHKEQAGNCNLLQSQVIKYDNHRQESSVLEAEKKSGRSKSKEKEHLLKLKEKKSGDELILNENDSRFLQPIEDSLKEIEARNSKADIEANSKKEIESSSKPEIKHEVEEVFPKDSKSNLSDKILFPSSVPQGSQNGELKSSIGSSKIQRRVPTQQLQKNQSVSQYESKLSQFRREQIRRLQQRSSIDQLQSNIVPGMEKNPPLNSGQVEQLSNYYNQFDPNESQREEKAKKELSQAFQDAQSSSSKSARSVQQQQQFPLKIQPEGSKIQSDKVSQINFQPSSLSNVKEDNHSKLVQRWKQQSINYQNKIKNRDISQSDLNNKESNSCQKNDLSKKMEESQLDSKNILEKSQKTEKRENRKQKSNLESSGLKKSKLSQQSSNLNKDSTNKDRIGKSNKEIVSSMKKSINSRVSEQKQALSNKDEQNTGNLLISNNGSDPIQQAEKKCENSASIRESGDILEQEKIFNTFPEKPNASSHFQLMEDGEEEFEDKQEMTPSSKVKYTRLGRDKLISYKQSSKKKQKLVKYEDIKEDHLERIRILKQAHKKRLQRELQKVQRQIEQINQKQRRMQNIYHELEKIQSESPPKQEKVSSHQSRRRKESEQFLKIIKEHKKSKEKEMIEFEDIDKHINSNLIELNKMREEAEEKKKEKKRMEIIDRMKQKQMKKMNELKLNKANQHYVHQFKAEVHTQKQLPKSPEGQRGMQHHYSNKQAIKQELQPEAAQLYLDRKPQHKSTRVTKLKSLTRKQEQKYQSKLN